MRYVSWAAFYEGPSDALYLDVLLPRVIRDLIAREGTGLVEIPDAGVVRLGAEGRSVESVAKEACAFREAIDIIFIHADTGGRALEQGVEGRSNSYCAALQARCGWPGQDCITIIPRHETEAWLLADGRAVTTVLGYNGEPADLGLPDGARAAEALRDPKQVLRSVMEEVAGRRRGRRIETLFPAIANAQRLGKLRASRSFAEFEDRVRLCLRARRCVVDGP